MLPGRLAGETFRKRKLISGMIDRIKALLNADDDCRDA